MPRSGPFASILASLRPNPSRAGASARPALLALALALAALPLGGCYIRGIPVDYHGTGSLQTSGVPAQLLADHHVAMLYCPAYATEEKHEESFSELKIGDRCVLEGDALGTYFRVVPGAECTLPFAEEQRTIRVTSVITQYPHVSYRYHDWSVFNVEVAGDDASGKHVVYRFTGQAKAEEEDSVDCSVERQQRHDAFMRRITHASREAPY